MDAGQLAKSTGATMLRALTWLAPIADAMTEFAINTPERKAAFLAQIGHESGGLKYTRELWGPTPTQLRYQGRVDLGNTHPGEGSKYRGRGFIQLTGRNNYAEAAKALHLDLLEHPEILEDPEMCAVSAAWWWQSHGLNELADAGDFPAITKRINGGMNGYAERFALWESAKQAFGVPV